MTDPTPGMYPGIDRASYDAKDAINQSVLKKGKRTWAHARWYQLNPPEPTPALQLGQAMHQAVLEPDKFEQDWTCPPMNPETHKAYDRRSKEGKAAWAAHLEENPGKQALSMKDWTFVLNCRRAVWEHAAAKAFLGGEGMNELGVVWQDEETGLYCKALIDRMTRFDGYTWVVDVKSTKDVSPRGWPREVVNYGLHIQAACYIEAMEAEDVRRGNPPLDRRFAFLCFEKEPPFLVKAWVCPPSLIEQGREEFHGLLRGWKKCLEDDNWPGYGQGLEEFNLPEWAYREVSDD